MPDVFICDHPMTTMLAPVPGNREKITLFGRKTLQKNDFE